MAQYTFDGTFAIKVKRAKEESIHVSVNQMESFFQPRLAIFKKNGDQRRHYITNVKVTSLIQKQRRT